MDSHMNKVFKRNDEVIMREIAGEFMLVPVSSSYSEGTLMMLSDTGAFLWNQMEQFVTVDDLVKKAMDEYDVDEVVVKEDVIGFLKSLLEIRLVIVEENVK